MIVDYLANLDWYPLKEPVREIFSKIQALDFSFEPAHTVPIGDHGVFVIPQQYILKAKEERVIEAHRTYIDLQIMVDGLEGLGVAYRGDLTSKGYDTVHDMETLTGGVSVFPFRQGQFAILFPDDAHMTGVKIPGSSAVVKKVVVKIPVILWKG